jgi:RTX calcium-binding nonapeptide repeat (4 copies)
MVGIILAAGVALSSPSAAIDDDRTLTVFGSQRADVIALRADANFLQIGNRRISRDRFDSVVVRARGGADRITVEDDDAPLEDVTLDGGSGNDKILGGSGDEVLLGREGRDRIDGNVGADVAVMGGGSDRFTWDPGDGSDRVEGQGGTDELLFNGAAAAENFDVSANGRRARFFRDVGNITIDLGTTERIRNVALGGPDTVTVGDLSGTTLRAVVADLAGDADDDAVTVTGTDEDDDIRVAGSDGTVDVTGLAAAVRIRGADADTETLTVETGAGDDTVDSDDLDPATIDLQTN